MSSVIISKELLSTVHRHGEEAYPEEGAGFLLGTGNSSDKHIVELLAFPNSREEAARHNRYLLTPDDYLRAEIIAMNKNLDVIGIFHSHPDHPNIPSEYDREWAIPNLSYIITSVYGKEAIESRSWQLTEDRMEFVEERLNIT